MERSEMIKDYIARMGMVVNKEIEDKEILIVSSVDLGLNNLIIDLENNHILFYLKLGTFKTDSNGSVPVETLTNLLQMNNPLSGMLTSGQFVIDTVDENILGFGEQQLLSTLDFEEFEDVINGFSTNLSGHIDFINSILIKKEGN